MIHVAICDDDYAIHGHAEKLILNLASRLCHDVKISNFFSGKEFCGFLSESGEIFDIVLMDIEMEDINGVDAGQMLRNNIENDKTLLIYISSHKNYYKAIIDLNVQCFISKPFNVEEFNLKLSKAFEKVLHQRQIALFPDFVIKKSGSEILIPLKSIKYLESHGRTIHLHATGNTHVYYGSLNAEEIKLPSNLFCRIHRSLLVCFSHVTSITSQSVTISGETLPISTKYRDSVKSAYLHYRGI